jgi:hypothetical protein
MIQWLEAAMLAEREAPRSPDRPRRNAMPRERLFVDMPKSLHRRFKAACIKTNRGMPAEIVALVERRIAELESTAR